MALVKAALGSEGWETAGAEETAALAVAPAEDWDWVVVAVAAQVMVAWGWAVLGWAGWAPREQADAVLVRAAWGSGELEEGEGRAGRGWAEQGLEVMVPAGQAMGAEVAPGWADPGWEALVGWASEGDPGLGEQETAVLGWAVKVMVVTVVLDSEGKGWAASG
ncbi:hypothetical protein HYH02_012138 [Chlamydomonas schloesseri]|uniref:Uncharacterized protein n=1 Tax=Chlamydomonas schloesseri TaxID=2026947 RepID=A0A835T085_9CHLO|nr:hypothetical protein HYH02_012138 [Chlamydomonas schloesseri]|eukprot:KAG2434941.1 hypothetical protein HYH02_012138 [Chlamydomonas schloesseri]